MPPHDVQVYRVGPDDALGRKQLGIRVLRELEEGLLLGPYRG